MARIFTLSVFLFLSFVGWVLEVAGISALQGILDRAAQANLSGNNLSYTSTAYEYLWWMASFQFTAMIVCAAVLAAPSRSLIGPHGAAGLLAVLTTSTFLMTNTVWDNPYTYTITHSLGSGGGAVDPLTNYGKTGRAVLTLLSGCIICSVFNVLLLLFFADSLPAASPKAAPAVALTTVSSPLATPPADVESGSRPESHQV